MMGFMKRVTLYSRSERPAEPSPSPSGEGAAQPNPEQPATGAGHRRGRTLAGLLKSYERLVLLAIGALLALVLAALLHSMAPPARPLSQRDIDAAVLHTLQTKPLPSRATKAYDIIRPSVVRVRRLGRGEDGEEDVETGVGSGVVIVDSGLILTSLHVVSGADHVAVVFYDGSESEAALVSAQPDQDLAVLQAKTLPDDLVPATLRSTRDLTPGDDVLAVGFPFGIGPSASAGIVSGLGREYRSPDGKQVLRNLIQFDAAANPGSSGGPLVTAEGEVVGVVTAILNPTDHQVFIGIGFAVPIESAAGAVGISPF
jgi:S1-C subfamily serine protease